MQTKILVTTFGLALAAAALPVSAATDTSNAQNPPGSESTRLAGHSQKELVVTRPSRTTFGMVPSRWQKSLVPNAQILRGCGSYGFGKTGSLTSQQYRIGFKRNEPATETRLNGSASRSSNGRLLV
jgi:hypothetical protein